MSQVRRTLLLSLLLLALGSGVVAWAYFGLHEGNRKKERLLQEQAKAFPWTKAEVSGLVLNPLGAKVELERKGEDWFVVEPVQALADQKVVNKVLDTLLSLRSEEVVSDELSGLDTHGLDFPPHSALLKGKGGTELLLKIGEQNPFNQSLPYIIGNDPRIHATQKKLAEALDKKAFDLRSKSLLHFRNDDVLELEVARSESSWKGRRVGKDWKLDAFSHAPGSQLLPDTADAGTGDTGSGSSVREGGEVGERRQVLNDWADDIELNKILTALRQARAIAFPSEDHDEVALRAFALDRPQLRVSLVLKSSDENLSQQTGAEGPASEPQEPQVFADSESRAAFDFALDEGSLYVRNVSQGPVMEFKADLFESLAKDPEELRDLRLARFDKEQVGRLEFVFGEDEPLVVNRRKEKKEGLSWESEVFSFEGREDKPKRWRLSSALHTLSILKAEAVVAESPDDLSPYGLDKPRLAFALFDQEGKRLVEILLGSESSESHYYALNTVDGRVVEVEQSTADELPQSVEDLLDSKAPTTSTP